MTQYNTSNVTFSNSQLNNLKSGIKHDTNLTFSSNVAGDSNDENNFPHQLSLTNKQASRLCKAFGKAHHPI